MPEDSVPLADNFERPNGDLVGEGWVEVEAEGDYAGLRDGRLCFLDSSDAINRPIVSRTFSAVSSGKLRWQFDFDWQLIGSEEAFAVFMQLGEGSLMDEDDPQAGAG